ncbi:MAG: hypothetical protein GY906_37720 [bacterium]|nr:hypothetical protein [bacterium]
MTDHEGSRRTGNLSAGVDGVVDFTLQYDSFHQAEDELGPFLASDGIFCVTDSPLSASTVVRIKVELPDNVIIVQGTGVVFWTRETDEGPDMPAGMAVRFASLAPRSKEVIEKLVQSYVLKGGTEFELEPKISDEKPAEQPAANVKPKKRSAPPMKMSLKVRGSSDTDPGVTPSVSSDSQPLVEEPEVLEEPEFSEETEEIGTPELRPEPPSVDEPELIEEPEPPMDDLDAEAAQTAKVVGNKTAGAEELTFDMTDEPVPEDGESRPSLEDQVPVSPPEPSGALDFNANTTLDEPIPSIGEVQDKLEFDSLPGTSEFGSSMNDAKDEGLETVLAPPGDVSLGVPEVEPAGPVGEELEEPTQPEPAPDDGVDPNAQTGGIKWIDDAPVVQPLSTPDEGVFATSVAAEEPAIETSAPEPADSGFAQAEQSAQPTGPLQASLEEQPSEPSEMPAVEVEPATSEVPVVMLEDPQTTVLPDTLSEPESSPVNEEPPDNGQGYTLEWKTSVPDADHTPVVTPDPVIPVSDGIGDHPIAGTDFGDDVDSFQQPSIGSSAATSARRGEGGEPKKGGGLRVLLLIIVLLGSASAAVWFVEPLREYVTDFVGGFLGAEEESSEVTQLPEGDPAEMDAGSEPSVDFQNEAESSGGSPQVVESIQEPVTQEPTRAPIGVPVSRTEVAITNLDQIATGVEEVNWVQAEGSTVIEIRGNGRFVEERIFASPMSSPPRVLLRLRRVETFPNYEMAIESQEVQMVRMGYHPELSPPALYVVLDLVQGARFEGYQLDGGRILITIDSQ